MPSCSPTSKSAQMFGMIERGNVARLALEPLAELRIGGRLIGNDFDGDIAAETGIAGAIHFAHTAGTNEADDFIGAAAGNQPPFCSVIWFSARPE